MMKFIEDKLEALDAYFAPKKESEKWMIILGVAGIISYFAFEYLLPYTQDMYKKTNVAKSKVEKSIKENERYLRSISRGSDRNYMVNKLTQNIEKRKKQIDTMTKKVAMIDSNLNKLSDMLFNQKNWSAFLNSITDKANSENVGLDFIVNNFVDNNGSFGHVLEIGLRCTGNYDDIVRFMNDMEQSVLVTDIYSSQMHYDQNRSGLVADINISVWGINR